jgi:hypothetical protein
VQLSHAASIFRQNAQGEKSQGKRTLRSQKAKGRSMAAPKGSRIQTRPIKDSTARTTFQSTREASVSGRRG